ncbi:hypothetical protein DB347_15590 [Opitutaceae bacterium EW11]|nr:hypothetical protein DB347_15590 [Opitutaceae bacterium EW11]
MNSSSKLLLPLALFGAAAVAWADGAVRPCCQSAESKPAPRAACCAGATGPASTPSPLTRNSLYQFDGDFQDDAGRKVTLAELRGRPVLVAMFFSSCTYACPMLMSEMAQVRENLPEPLRSRVALVLVSFDSDRDTSDALRAFRSSRGLSPQWRLWRSDPATIRGLAAALGVNYRREANGQFSHSNLLTVLNAEGEIVHRREGLAGSLDGVMAALSHAPAGPTVAAADSVRR